MAKARRAAQVYHAYRDISRPGTPGLLERVRALPRMIGATRRGEYGGLSKGKLTMLGLAVLYIVSPIDAIPDFLVGIGVVDDFGVFLWLMATLLGESGDFLRSERGGHVQGEHVRGDQHHGR
ncbi:YkvA family protein [Acrocarpospora catenulata]|uniref:YkvA family protein n=1 Tax=Acrocarpospora catenulata TaxID=2836182 RepID=UPI001BDA0DBE|nr:YkvA family protein [Acrocarpospora catenulata]